MEFLEVQGGGDAAEFENIELPQPDTFNSHAAESSVNARPSSKSKEIVPEAWDDDAGGSDYDSDDEVNLEPISETQAGLNLVLRAFIELRADFDAKFRVMWA